MLQFWIDFINSLRSKRDDSSQIALGRLKGAVSMDRLSLPPSTLDQIRVEVVRTISRYLVIDESAMTLAVQAEGRHVALAASIPVLRPRQTPLPDRTVPAVPAAPAVEAAPPPSRVPALAARELQLPGAPREGDTEGGGASTLRPVPSPLPVGAAYDRSRARALRRRRQTRR